MPAACRPPVPAFLSSSHPIFICTLSAPQAFPRNCVENNLLNCWHFPGSIKADIIRNISDSDLEAHPDLQVARSSKKSQIPLSDCLFSLTVSRFLLTWGHRHPFPFILL